MVVIDPISYYGFALLMTFLLYELKLFMWDLQNYDMKLKFEVTDCGHSANCLDISVDLEADEINDDLLRAKFSVYRNTRDYPSISILFTLLLRSYQLFIL